MSLSSNSSTTRCSTSTTWWSTLYAFICFVLLMFVFGFNRQFDSPILDRHISVSPTERIVQSNNRTLSSLSQRILVISEQREWLLWPCAESGGSQVFRHSSVPMCGSFDQLWLDLTLWPLFRFRTGSTTGSYDNYCKQYGGECNCKPNVIGRECNQCKAKSWGFSPNGCLGTQLISNLLYFLFPFLICFLN